MHYQVGGNSEDKIVTCEGKVFDVIVDIRKNSKFFKMVWENIR